MGIDRQSFLRRRIDGGDIAHPGQRHIQRAGDGGGRQGQDIHFGAQLLQEFLVGHPEALLLIDDHQPQVLELHIRLDQPVGADDDIHLAHAQLADDLILLLWRPEAGQHLHGGRERQQALLGRCRNAAGPEWWWVPGWRPVCHP